MSDILAYLCSLFAFNDDHPLLFTQIHFWVLFLIIYLFFGIIVARQCKQADGTLDPTHRVLRNGYLFAFSLFFYYKTSGLFVLLLVFSTLLGWILGIGMDKPLSYTKRKTLRTIGVVVNLGVLCFFKYAYFFTDIFNATFGTEYSIAIKIFLPVGISFFTFQNISYIVDVYKRKIHHVSNILDFGFYTAFFPQLVAGPILRADQFVPQLYKPFFLSRRQFGIAVFWICNGLIKKIILSDYLAVSFVDRVFENPLLYTPFENFSALIVYSLQVYADFSGYTDIAIGLSMLMGFHLPMNFNSPYKAPNCSNFWKRWHISLSRWLQTYLYIPLGGNRNVTGATYFWITVITLFTLILSGSVWLAMLAAGVLLSVIWTAYRRPEKRRHIYANLNAMITMLLGGLWHGASCNFLVWGGLNGLGMIVYKFWRDYSPLRQALYATAVTAVLAFLAVYAPAPLWNVLLVFVAFICLSAWLRWLFRGVHWHVFGYVNHAWCIAVTFTFITFTRLFFRSGSNLDPAVANETAWRIATEMIRAIGSRWNVNVVDVCMAYRNVFLLFLLGMIIHWLPTDWKRRYRLSFARLPLPAIYVAVLAAVFLLYQFVTAEMQPFIYFQF